MPVTLNDEQLAQLRARLEAGARAEAIAEGATQIWNDPQLSDEAKRLWKRKFPDGQIPEYDAEQRVYQRLDKEKAEREAAAKERRDRALDERIAKQRAEVQKKYKFTDDAMKRLEDTMTERNVADYEVAAHWLASQEPSPSEGDAGYDRHFWHHDKTPDYKEIAADPEDWARRNILQAIRSDELARQKR